MNTEKATARAVMATAGEDPQEKAGHRGFQSKEAMKSSMQAKLAPVEEDGEVIQGEVADMSERPRQIATPEEVDRSMEMVQVKSRENIPPFFYGKKQYSLPANKNVLIPRAVQAHLQEKGKL